VVFFYEQGDEHPGVIHGRSFFIGSGCQLAKNILYSGAIELLKHICFGPKTLSLPSSFVTARVESVDSAISARCGTSGG
jgi:hypothetical protein